MPNTLRPPPEVIASFPPPNHINPQDRGPGLIVTACLLSVIATSVVGARLYTRFRITRSPGIDDALIVLALIFGLILSILVIISSERHYVGYHVWDVPITSATPHRINVWAAQLCYTLALTSVKVSVLLFYRRLSSVSVSRTFVVALWVGIAYNALYCLGFIFTLCFIYRPLQAYWLSFSPGYTAHWTAGREEIATPLSALFSVLGDVYATILPLILVRGLALPRSQKWALYGLFSLGFATVVFGALRTWFVYAMMNRDWDFTWTLWEVWIWSLWEMWLGVVVASAPALKGLVTKLFGWKGGSRGSGGSARAVYVVKSDDKGGIGKVERRWVSKNRCSAVVNDGVGDGGYVELEPKEASSKGSRMGIEVKGNHIVKQIEYDVERFGSVEALPDWDERWIHRGSASATKVSGPLTDDGRS